MWSDNELYEPIILYIWYHFILLLYFTLSHKCELLANEEKSPKSLSLSFGDHEYLYQM